MIMIAINDTPQLRVTKLSSCHEGLGSYALQVGKRADNEGKEKKRDPFAVAFGVRLRDARLAKVKPPLTGEALGTMVGATKMTISHWENGVHMPDLAQLAALADALGCSADQLLGRSPVGLSAEALEEARAYEELPAVERKKWRAMRLTLFSPA
jgi:transcriptional regulator with XRE-family HTH domain